ncbi:helix-turn-helix domain-containing protein [Haloparvum sedimenti]|uniref:helix-turn-helix domain-containing protein n=1 Tax=Haloparvum sedimenti TaxID=1678448 RepID=UPI00071E697E|nr:helix-turn-helix domain-containing protein [Haloparvum sedimenti]
MSRSGQTEPAGPVIEVEFALREGNYPFLRGSAVEECTFELAKMVPRRDGGHTEYFSVTGADPARIAALAEEHETAEVSLLTEYDRGGLFEFRVLGNCPAHRLAELGALPQVVEATDGTGRIVADIPAGCDTGAVIDAFLTAVPAADLTAKRGKESVTPLFTLSGVRQVLRTRLTDRQFEVLVTALEAGYYEWPRECSGEDVAEELRVSSATFAEHIRAAERKLLTLLFERSELGAPGRR